MNPSFHRHLHTAAFTLIELLVVIAIIGILAALTSGLIAVAKSRSLESRIEAERDMLVTMIEDYRSKMGFYPPDNVNPVTGAVNPFAHPLYYELSGMLTDHQAGVWRYPEDTSKTVSPADVERAFRIDGFSNVADEEVDLVYKPGRIRSSMIGNLEDSIYEVDLRVLVVPAIWREHDHGHAPESLHSPLVSDNGNPMGVDSKLNPWRYVVSSPTNNPGRFDLWAEVVIGDEVKIIGNWQE